MTLSFVALAAMRRLVGRRRRAGWTARLEIIVAAYRGLCSVISRMGWVRFRNVTEALLPLMMRLLMPRDGLTPRFVHEKTDSGLIDGAWVEPPGASTAVLLYFHGGAFTIGSLRSHIGLISALAHAAQARTLFIEYRLAPEHPAPAAHEDAMSAYRYLLAQGVPAKRIVLAGDSAGGNLVLCTLLALRDAGEPLPAAAVAISPGVDCSSSDESFRTNAAFDYLRKEDFDRSKVAYVADKDPRAFSPLFADLSGLPPLLLHAGEAEVLVDQIRSFAGRAQAAGVDVELSVYPDMVHVWHILRGWAPEAQRAIDEIGAFVRRHVT